MHFSPLVRLACRALFGMALAAPIVAVAGPGLHYSGTPVDVPTYHYDSARTGWNRSETDLTPATVASTRFGLLKTLGVDGDVLAQPLLISNFVMPDGSTHDILVVVTGHNSVYAFDAQTYAVLWQVNLGPSQASSDIGCHELDPAVEIRRRPDGMPLDRDRLRQMRPEQLVELLHRILDLILAHDQLDPIESDDLHFLSLNGDQLEFGRSPARGNRNSRVSLSRPSETIALLRSGGPWSQKASRRWHRYAA